MGIGKWIGRPSRAVMLVAVGAAGAGAAIAVAAVPDSTGVIHACLNMTVDPAGATVPSTGGPNVVIIDPSAGQHCMAPDGAGPNQSSISWNQTGSPGPAGAQGLQGIQGPAGNTLTIAGQAFSLSNGKTLTINGTPLVAPLPPNPGGRAIGKLSLDLGQGGPSAIEVLSWSFGASQGSSSHASGGGGGAGKVKFNEFTIRKLADKASPQLFKACASGTHFKNVTLTVRKAGGRSSTPFLTVTLHDALISSYQQSNGGDTPTESVSFNFAKIGFEYSKK